ncbi:MAG: TldD/PmbA family protein [Paracoccaceae bacterium]
MTTDDAPRDLSGLSQRLLDAARRAGADAADALVVDGRSLSIEVRQGVLEQAERSEGADMGLRVLIGRRQACVSASDTSDETIRTMAERAVAMAREAPEDPYAGLADPAQLSPARDASGLELCDPAAEPEPDALLSDALAAEAAALAVDGVAQVQSAGAGYGARRIHLAASNGFHGGYARTDRATSCVAIAGEGATMERDFDHDARVFQSDLRDPSQIGRRAGERAVARHGARRPRTGAYPVLFDERVAGGLIGHLLQAANGMMVARGSSWARDLMGERVLPAGLDLIEDPLRPRVMGSRPFDAEGLGCAARHVVRDGVLTGWTLDLASARKLGMDSTASAARGTSGPPTPQSSNVALTQGTATPAELMAQMGTGLWITSMIGSTINPSTGDYSRGAAGIWVENGQPTHPVNECTVAGNLIEMLRGIVPADDARPWTGRVVPSLLVEGLTLAGD